MEGVRGFRILSPAGFIALLIALIAIAVLMSLLPAPASAYLRDEGFVLRSTSSDSQGLKSKDTACPSGQRAISGGAFVDPFGPNLALQSAGPLYSVGKFVTAAAETDPVSDSWRLRDVVHCFQATNNSPNFFLVANGEPYIKSVTTRTRQSSSSSSGTKTEDVDCGPGRTAISGGARIVSTSRNIALQATSRTAGARGWQARAREVDSTSASWRLNVYAVCANVTTESGASDYAHPIQLNSNTTSLSSSSSRDNFAACSLPAPLQRVIGGGAAVLGSGSSRASRNVALTESYPDGQRWDARARETDPTSSHWRLRVWVVCAGSAPGP